MRRTRTAITLVVVLIGALAGSTVASAQAAGSINAEPEDQSHVVSTGATIVATVDPVAAGVPVFWTESGPGDIVEADSVTDANGQATAITTSNTPGEQFVTAWRTAPAGACADTATTCDTVKVTWTPKQSANQPALECSGGAYAILADPILGPTTEVPYVEEPCPTEGTPSEPTVRRDSAVDVPASPLVFATLLEARSEFTSTHSESTTRAVGVIIGDTLGIEVAGTRARSECSANGVASQELDGGQVVITQMNGTPDDPSDDEVVFSGIAPPNTEIPLDPLINIKLNEQLPDEGGMVGPELPGEKQNRHAEGEVNAVNVSILGGAITIIVGHAESDITCKRHTWAIDLEPENQTAETGTQATVVATVTDEAGRPVAGEDVTWTTTGVGSIVSAESQTDENGQAEAVLTSDEEGDQAVTASLDPAKTKCNVTTPPGVCEDSVLITWEEDDIVTPATQITVTGHAHADYDGDGAVHLSKNDRGDVHIGANLTDNLVDSNPPSGRLGYWDLRPNPPGPMQDEFRCEHFSVESITPIQAPLNVVQIDGTVGRCNKSQRDPSFTRFRLFIRDNGPNPPNQDGYHMIFFGPGGNVVYDWEDATTVGLGDLTIEQV